MQCYRLVETSFQKSHYSIINANNGRRDTEYKLNDGFSEVSNIIEWLSQTGETVDVQITLDYQKNELSYYICVSEILDNYETICFTKSKWEKSKNLSDSYTSATTLHGALHLAIGNASDSSFIDNLIKLYPYADFRITLSFTTERELGTKEKYLDELNEVIKALSEQKEKNRGGALGFGEGNRSTRKKTEVLYEYLSELFYFYSNHSISCYRPRITISAPDKRTVEKVLIFLHGTSSSRNTYTTKYLWSVDEYAMLSSEIDKKEFILIKLCNKWNEFFAGLDARFGLGLGIYDEYRISDKLKAQFCLNFCLTQIVPLSFISVLAALPTKRVPGIINKDEFDYGSCPSSESQTNSLDLGKLIISVPTLVNVPISISDLIKHTLVTGVTGSGKTTTIKSMLLGLYDNKKPFLILEPAKTEYKDLKIEGLKRYLLGIETEGCLKLNPFKFPYIKGGTHGVHLQTHLDLLKSIFIAAFPMYGPMPYVLETAFYHIYQWYGWDFKSGHNIYWDDDSVDRSELFPTLDDLYNAIDHIVSTQGYSKDLQNDLTAALKVRIGSLKSGAKGTMLNTKRGTDIGELLSCPTVVELERIGDAQEKVFIMGLLLVSIYEHYIAEGTESEEQLKHLLVIEEAHRLLENVQQSNNNEIADMKGKAIETFNNILSEIRAYGQGIVVADQIPTKISPDVIKNTNLKIIHRLFSLDDRNAVGDAIGLDHKQKKGLIHLNLGEAIVFHAGLPEAVKITVDSRGKEKGSSVPMDEAMDLNPLDVVVSTTAIYSEAKKAFQTALVFDWSFSILKEKLGNILTNYSIESDGDLIDQLMTNLVEWFAIKLRNNKSIPYSFRNENKFNKLRTNPVDAIKAIRGFIDENRHTIQFPNTLESTCVDALAYFIYVYAEDRKAVSKVMETISSAREANFRYCNTETQSMIVAETGLDIYFCTDDLSDDEILELCQCLVYFCSYPHTGFGYYFDPPNTPVSDEEYKKQLQTDEEINPATVSTTSSSVDTGMKSLLESIAGNLKDIGQKQWIDPAIKNLVRLPLFLLLANTLLIILAVLIMITR